MNCLLITGAAGFIGSHVSEALLDRGFTIVGLDNFDEYYPARFKEKNVEALKSHTRYKLIRGDIRDKDLMETILREHSVRVVLHLAARAGVRPSIQNPVLYADVNVTGTMAVLEAMRVVGVRRMVFASSSSVYGNRNSVPFSENENVDAPVSPYAATKRAGELLCYNYHHLYGFDVSCLRFFTAYGPRQRPDMAIHKFVRRIYKKEPIQIYGDGSSRRDYTFIGDIVDGVVRAMDKARGFQVYNLGDSIPIGLRKLISMIENRLERKAIIESLPFQPGDVSVTCADISKAREDLGYDPKTNVEEGLDIFCSWFQNNSHWLIEESS